ncbi:hypothetical protein L798_00283 [Zootermopsis nevadensis]|uniref:Uncharacterized protein n=1 Tax=Zootermopsis nevadensis TaxID=136037 RepID=A0A067RGF0_ZOONE|nr:hypothetical protein L798_00283 [Zootermopsis nevadensis]
MSAQSYSDVNVCAILPEYKANTNASEEHPASIFRTSALFHRKVGVCLRVYAEQPRRQTSASSPPRENSVLFRRS